MSVLRSWSDWSCTVAVRTEREFADRAEAQVRSLMADVERAISRFRTDSDIAVISSHGGRLVPVAPLTVQLVGLALDAAAATDGAVDPTVGAQVAALGYDRDIDEVRRGGLGEATGLVQAASWRDVRIDRELGLVGVPAGVELDLGAVAKAWTADESARRVAALSGAAAFVEIGGDVAAAGRPTTPWQVDVAETRGGPGTRVAFEHGGLATSSTGQRCWTTSDGRRVNHVVDPATGRAVDGPWRTVSVWAPTALRANTLSTAALVRGPRVRHLLHADGIAARIVAADGTVELVGNWPPELQVAA